MKRFYYWRRFDGSRSLLSISFNYRFLDEEKSEKVDRHFVKIISKVSIYPETFVLKCDTTIIMMFLRENQELSTEFSELKTDFIVLPVLRIYDFLFDDN